MIIVLDTTVLLQDPQLRASWWTELRSTAERVGARIAVPQVVFAEAVAHHGRTIGALAGQMETFGKHVKRYGLDTIRDAAVKAIREKVDAYEDKLRGHLEALGVDFVPPVKVDHMTLIGRAVAFRKPWDESDRKDGYRDTLNWLTVVELAKENPGEEIWWVSDNSSDFAAPGENDEEWHPELADELNSEGLLERVSLTKSVSTLFAALADRTAPIPEADKSALLEKVSLPELAGLISSEVLATKLDPREAALPRDTGSAEVTSFAGLSSDVEWESLAGSGDGHIIGRFLTRASLGLDLVQEQNGVATVSFRRKMLEVSGVATLTHEGRIIALSVTSIEAAADDTGHSEWQPRQTEIFRPAEPIVVVQSDPGEESPLDDLIRSRIDSLATELMASGVIGEDGTVTWETSLAKPLKRFRNSYNRREINRLAQLIQPDDQVVDNEPDGEPDDHNGTESQ